MPKVYRRVLDLREEKDMTQKQVAEALNCSQQAYSDYERGRTSLSAELLEQLADFYGVSVDYILGRTDVRETAR